MGNQLLQTHFINFLKTYFYRILTRLNQPDSEDQDLDNLTSEMENLVGKAEQIEANIENIENMGSEVQIVVKDYDESEDDKSLDDEVCNITSDLGNGVRRGKRTSRIHLSCSGKSFQALSSMNGAPRIQFVSDSQRQGFYPQQRPASREHAAKPNTTKTSTIIT